MFDDRMAQSPGLFLFKINLKYLPMNEGALGVHEIELVVEPGPSFGDGRGVGQHADGALDLGEIASRDDRRGLIVDADFESGGAPIHELDRTLGLDGGNGGINVLGNDVASVQHAARHVLA